MAVHTSTAKDRLSLTQQPDIFRKALALHQAGNLAQARELYVKALRIDPRHFDSLHLLGLVLVQSGDLDGGIISIRKALALNPDVAEAQYNLGNALLTARSPTEALAHFNKALQLAPNDAQAHFEAGNALKELRRNEEAVVAYGAAIRLDQNYAEAFNNRGIALKDMGRLEEAVASYDAAIALRPRYAEAHSNRGNALKDLHRFEEALDCHDRAIALKSDYAEAHYNRANVLGDLRRFEEALLGYDAAIALRSDYAEARHNKAQLLLGLGRFREGFELYRSRWESPVFASERFQTSLPGWDGRILEGGLLLWPEQGIGDEIFYASLLPLILHQGMTITLAADRRLTAIYQRSFPDIRILDSEAMNAPLGDGFTAQAPIGDLGAILKVDPRLLAERRTPFLRSDQGRREALVRDNPFLQSRPVVGLSWKSANKKFGAEKSLRLIDLRPLLSIPGLTFVSLQYGEVSAEIEEVRTELGVEVHRAQNLDVFADIDGLLALVDVCDRVITTSNVTAHLAGALCKHGVVLVPQGKGCLWYWQGGANNLWYPSLTRVQQDSRGQWAEAIEVAAGLVRNSI